MVTNVMETIIRGDEAGDDSGVLADRLRGRQARSTLAQLSGDSVLAPFGAQEAKTVRSQSEQIRSSSLKRAKEAAIQKRHEAQLSATERMHAESQATRLEMGKLAAQARGLTRSRIPKDIREKLMGHTKSISSTQRLLTRLKEGEMVGSDGMIPGMNTLKNTVARYGVGDEKSIRTQKFWQDLSLNLELGLRHRLFGTALTPTEQKSWQDAFVNPEMTTAQVGGILNSMDKLFRAELKQEMEGATAQGYDAEGLSAYGATTPSVMFGQAPTPQTGSGEPLPGAESEPAEQEDQIMVEGVDF